jgi:hypothetical protein
MKRVLLRALALGLVAAGLAAQETSEVFAPFVSRLRAAPGEEAVVLTWRRSEDVQGSYLIYRSRAEITEETFAQAEFIARVDATEESYTDFPPFGLDVYYAVLIQGSDGRLYSIFIPFRNKTSAAVRITPPVPESDTAAEVRDLEARVQGQNVVLTFTSSNPGRDLLLFRATRPIRRLEDLIESGLPMPLPRGATLHEDRPIAGVEYYYGIADTRLLQSGRAPIVPGQNSTVQPAAVPLRVAQIASPARSRPLPRLMIPTGVEFGDELIPSPPFLLPRQQELGAATAKSVARFRAAVRPAPTPPIGPAILEEERAAQPLGEESILAEIIQTSFASGNYTDAEDRLERFLRIERSSRTKARASFYLGQILFLRGDVREAFLAFLLANDAYYADTQPWVDAAFAAL